MTQVHNPQSPLRQRMIEDMRLRKLSPRTQTGYLRAVIKLTCFLGRPPDTATAEDLRRFQLHLVDGGTSSITLNTCQWPLVLTHYRTIKLTHPVVANRSVSASVDSFLLPA